ncbi:MAG TPA: T9SS type A sorting domain-containing protein [Prolixibacteraceae bacterium]|nr:T9SS type A sorting domain-containing protein [Prolixibacteraceae bacterium]
MKKVLLLVIAVSLFHVSYPQLIINHNHTDITGLSEAQINLAKSALHIAYGHTSHGSQVTDGMSGLVGFANGGGKGLELPANIFAWNNGGTGGALDLHDYAMGGDVGYYPDWYNNTVNYLENPANSDVNVIMWSWCGQASGRTEQTMIDTYLAPMTLLENTYPNVKFVYMTGHLDGSGLEGNLNQRNQQIRDYCTANNKILYDFADIESYDPDALVNYMELYANDNCDYDSSGNSRNWATRWQNSHTENVDWYDCYCAHSQALNGNQKAYAAWHLFVGIANLINLGNIAANHVVSDTLVGAGESACFDATDTLTAAGDGTDVEIGSGGFAEFISGGIIRFLPGFHALSGSVVQAFITTANEFCQVIPLVTEQAPVTAKSTTFNIPVHYSDPAPAAPLTISLYPNPNNGIFTINTHSEEENLSIRVFNNTGAKVYQSKIIHPSTNVNLQTLRSGIYILQVAAKGQLRSLKFIIE